MWIANWAEPLFQFRPVSTQVREQSRCFVWMNFGYGRSLCLQHYLHTFAQLRQDRTDCRVSHLLHAFQHTQYR